MLARALRFRAHMRAQGSGTGTPHFPKKVGAHARLHVGLTTQQINTPQYGAAAAGSTATSPRPSDCAPGSGATHPDPIHTHIGTPHPTNASGTAPIARHEDWIVSLYLVARARILHALGGPDGRAGHPRGARLPIP